MSATRRGFLGWLAAISAAPAAVGQLGAPKPILKWGHGGNAGSRVNAVRDQNVLLRPQDYVGVPVVNFRGVPIRVVDSLL